MSAQERLLAQLLVPPGQAAGIAERDPGWTGGPEFADLAHDELEQRAKDALARGIAELSDAQELLWATDRYSLLVVLQAMDAAGKDSAIEHVMSGVNPQGVQVVSFKQPSARGARPRLPLAHLEGAARARPHRHLQPLALRGGRRAEGPPRVARAAAPPARRSRRGVLAGALRGHQRLRAPPRPQRDEDREVLPARLEGGAEAALPRAARQAGQGVEVQRGRRRGAGSLGRLHGRLRGRADGHVDAVGAVVRDPGRPQVAHAGARRAVLVETLRSLDLRWPEVSAADHAANLEARKKLEAEPAAPLSRGVPTVRA